MNPYYDTNVLYDAGDRAMNGSQFKYASKLYKLNQLLITAKITEGTSKWNLPSEREYEVPIS